MLDQRVHGGKCPSEGFHLGPCVAAAFKMGAFNLRKVGKSWFGAGSQQLPLSP